MPQAVFTRKLGDRRFQSIGMWPAIFPPALQGRSQQEHTSAYFEIEKQKPRYEGKWEGFVEGERDIAGRRFPTMTFRVSLLPQHFVTDGLFVLYFPEDYDVWRKFYVFMWMDGHPDDQPGSGLDVLDAIVSSVAIRR